MYYVYILVCSDGSYYTGSTNNIQERFKNHIEGMGAKYTKSHKPEKIIYQEKFFTKSKALKREAELKKWTKAKKRALIHEGLVS